jgi:hypothetical protein
MARPPIPPTPPLGVAGATGGVGGTGDRGGALAAPTNPAAGSALDNPVERRTIAKSIAQDAMRGDDGDTLGELNPLDVKFFRNARVNVQIPVLDPVECRRALVFLRDELPGLVAEMDRVKDRRSKSLLAMTKLRAWSQAFGRRGRK